MCDIAAEAKVFFRVFSRVSSASLVAWGVIHLSSTLTVATDKGSSSDFATNAVLSLDPQASAIQDRELLIPNQLLSFPSKFFVAEDSHASGHTASNTADSMAEVSSVPGRYPRLLSAR